MDKRILVVETLNDYIKSQGVDEALGDYFRKSKIYKYNFIAPIILTPAYSADDIMNEFNNYSYRGDLDSGIDAVQRKYGYDFDWINQNYRNWENNNDNEDKQQQVEEIDLKLQQIKDFEKNDSEENFQEFLELFTDIYDELYSLRSDLDMDTDDTDTTSEEFEAEIKSFYDNEEFPEDKINEIQESLDEITDNLSEKSSNVESFLEDEDEMDEIFKQLQRDIENEKSELGWIDGDDAEEIAEKIMEDYNESKLEQYFDEDDKKRAGAQGGDYKVISMRVIDVNVAQSNFTIQVVTDKPITEADKNAIKDYLEGQNSDGWGEGFEQHEIGNWYVHTWYHKGKKIYFGKSDEIITPSKFVQDKEKVKTALGRINQDVGNKLKQGLSNLNPANYRVSISKKK